MSKILKKFNNKVLQNKYFNYYYLIFCGLVFYIILKIFRINNFSNENFGCINLFGQGEIYSGEIGCAQGPVFYFVGLIFKKISGVFFSEIFLIFVVLVSVLILYFVFKILEKEKEKINYFLLLFLYLAFICFLFLDPPNYYPSTLLSAFFVFSAVYLMFYSKLKYRFLISGGLFGLAIFTKMNALPIVGLVCLYYLIKKRKIKDLIKVLVPILVIAGMFKLIFPNLFLYLFGTQFKLQGFSFISKILHADFSVYNSQFIFVLSFLVLSFIGLLKLRDLFSSVSFFGFVIILISAINTHGWLDFIKLLQYRYFLPIMPFFVIMLIKFKNKIVSRKLLYFVFILFLVILIYIPFKFTVVPSVIIVNSMEDKMLSVLEFVPIQEDSKILAYGDLTKYNKNFKGKLDIYPDPERLEDNIDIAKLKTYIPTGIANLSEKWSNLDGLSERTTPYYDKILNNNYDVIIFGFLHKGNKLISLFTYILGKELGNEGIVKIFEDYKKFVTPKTDGVEYFILHNNNLMKYNSIVYVPLIERYGDYRSMVPYLLAFKEPKKAEEFKIKLEKFHKDNLGYFCNLDMILAEEVIKRSLRKNDKSFSSKVCESYNFVFSNIKQMVVRKFSLKDFFICLILTIIYIENAYLYGLFRKN